MSSVAFTGQEFMTLASFVMINDNEEHTECIDVDILHSLLDQIAVSMGFDDWVSAYHQLELE